MTEIINLPEVSGLVSISVKGFSVPVVDARRVHQFSFSPERFERWMIRTVRRLGLRENRDYFVNGRFGYQLTAARAREIFPDLPGAA